MIKYKKVYLDALGFDECDFIPCEISGLLGVDLHHIIGRGNDWFEEKLNFYE